MDINNTENKIQYILDENENLVEMLKSDARIVDQPIKYKLKNAFEVFVLVEGAENYWISNYGRCVNNLNHKDKNTFYEHKQGQVHYTIYEVTRIPVKNKKGRLTGEINEERYKRDTTPEDLVADAFLKSYRGRCKIWHKDGNYSNNWYKNLIYVTNNDYKKLKDGIITWQSLNYEQEYIEYENKASAMANKVYYAIRKRCSDDKVESYHACYEEAEMCQEWLENPQSFIKWYLEHYYEVDGESMAVDKDLFGDGSKMYSPQTGCILPQGLNTLLSNCKKHYKDGDNENNVLPLGVRYNSKNGKYYGEIQFTGTEKQITLSEWNTKEEAFAEYKVMKQADICLVIAQYKEKVPNYIYNKFLQVEVKPY